MTKLLIQQYRANREKLIRYGGSRNESVLRKAFQELLDYYARSKNLLLVPEVEHITEKGHKVYPDGTLKDALRLSWGFWESKDEADVLEDEIVIKFRKGYPKTNILFEDTQRAILYQNGEMVMTAIFEDDAALDAIITRFVGYEPPEVREFRKAIETFRKDVPALAKALREIIEEQIVSSSSFRTGINEFLDLCRKAINPKVEMAEVKEMIIQHILTEDIFMRVFDESEFHRENVVARKLQEVAGTFYKGATRHNIDARIAPYYETINARAAQISDHHEKQKFLKALYENFYKAYNPQAADRLGVIYTPDEVVRFMIESTDHLLWKHFGKTLGDQYVDILDPATGTGTFITELIEYLPTNQLDLKYETELHCNEVAILPYYIANLNIEYTYKQKTGKFREFENICFVDTLDNTGFSTSTKPQLELFGFMDENVERINRQNNCRISVIIGNPPYNAKQPNYNYQNSNRPYPEIDKHIKSTYIKAGTAQNQNAVYDMYTRFLRWASNRLDQNGIVAFVSNNSFLEKAAFDGFRRIVAKEFNEIYVLNMKGNAHPSGEERKRQGGNVFHDQIKVGIAIYFLVRSADKKGCQIFVKEVSDYTTSKEKLDFLSENKFEKIQFNHVIPDKNANWINQSKNDWEKLIPLVKNKQAIFELLTNGVKTQRDDWVFDYSPLTLEKKMQYFLDIYTKTLLDPSYPEEEKMSIKWDSDLTNYLKRRIKKEYNPSQVTNCLYRPFVKTNLYLDRHLNGRTYQWFSVIKPGFENVSISYNLGAAEFVALASDVVVQLGTLLVGGGSTQCVPFYRLTKDGEPIDNVSEWALKHFRKQYHDESITKENIFHYVYAVFHNPSYREIYKQDLKREIPRIPLYKDFWKWAKMGSALMDLHINYEQAPLYPLQREDKKTDRLPTPILIARKNKGAIEIDTITSLLGIPDEAWQYRPGTYTALEWILERYKEKKSKDKTVQEKFNTYKFADYKEQVIDLIMRVCTVSVETMKIINQMPDSM